METNETVNVLSEADSKPITEDVVVETEVDGDSEILDKDDEAKAKAEELMKLISDLEVLRSYRKARHAGERKQVSKDERKKKKAKRRQANKSRRH